MQALTSTDDEEITQCLRTLESTHAGMFFMHESFHKDDDMRFTRRWEQISDYYYFNNQWAVCDNQ